MHFICGNGYQATGSVCFSKYCSAHDICKTKSNIGPNLLILFMGQKVRKGLGYKRIKMSFQKSAKEAKGLRLQM
jgi:hypothetical protein